MSPRSIIEELRAVTEHGGVDGADLEAAYHLIQSNKLSFEQAATMLLEADGGAGATRSLQPSPTIGQLLEAWGPPPRPVVEDWIEQLQQQLRGLERLAAECQRAPPSVAAALTLEAICIDPQNRLTATELDALQRSLRGAAVSPAGECTFPEPSSVAKLHPAYRCALDEFAQQIDPQYAATVPPTATESEGVCCDIEPASENRAALAVGDREIASTGKRRGGRKRSTRKPHPRRFWSVAAVLALFGTGFAFLALNRGEQSEGLEVSSTAGEKDPTGTTANRKEDSDEEAKGLGSFATDAAPQTQSPAENDSRALLDQLARVGGDVPSPSEPLRSDDDPAEDFEPSTSASGQPSPADQAIGSSGFGNRSAGEEDSVADAVSVMAAEPPGGEELDLDAAIDPARDRAAPIVDDPSVDAVLLPPLDEETVSARLHPEPAEEVLLDFLGPPVDGEPQQTSHPPLRLIETEPRSDCIAAWEVVETHEEVPASIVGRIFCDRSGTHFSWSPDVQKRLATDLRNGRLRLRFAEAASRPLFLRPPQQTDPVGFDFEQQKLEIAWQLSTPPHPSASRLQIDFQLPESTASTWIEPTHLQPPRRLVAIAELSLKESAFAALRMRFDVQTGSRLVCRVSYTARLDATLPWQRVTMPKVVEEADRVAAQHASVLTQLQQLEAFDGRRGRRSWRDMLRRRRQALQQRSEQLVTVAERLDHLIELMESLKNDGQVGWRLIAEWPDGPQTIFATPFS